MDAGARRLEQCTKPGSSMFIAAAVTAAILACALFAAGCARQAAPKIHEGDLGLFLVQTIAQLGGRSATTNELPAWPAKWTLETLDGIGPMAGREQITVHIPGDQFQPLTNVLFRAFGAPAQSVRAYRDETMCGYYAGGEIGVGLQFFRNKRETGAIIVGKKP